MRRFLLQLLIDLTVCQLLWARFIINPVYSDYQTTMLDYQSTYHPHSNGYTNQFGYGNEYVYNPYYTTFQHMFPFSRSMPFMYNSPGSYYDEWRKVHRPLPGGGSCIFVDYYKQCSEGFIGLKSHPTQQQYYYICKPDQIILSKCLHSQIFNNTTRQCVQQQNLEYIPTCTNYGIYPILYDCNLYYRCDRNLHYRLYNCPNDMIFSLTQRKCVRDNKCIPKQIISNHTYIPESLGEKFPPCLKVGIYRSPTDCSLYFKCEIQSNGIYLQTRFRCPEQRLYDVNRHQCVPQQDNHYDCFQIDRKSINSNIDVSEEGDNSSFSSEETEGSGNDELPIITDETTDVDENMLSTTIIPELIIPSTNSDVSDTTKAIESLTTTPVPLYQETNTAVLSDDDKLDASGNTYTSKTAMKMSGVADFEDFDISSELIKNDSDKANNEIDEQTIELSNSKESHLLEDNLIAVTETAMNKENTNETILESTSNTTIIEESNTEPCTKSTTDLPAIEIPSQVPHLEIIAKRPLDVHLSVCPNNCSRIYKPENDLKDNPMVLLRWFNNATNKTFILDQEQN